MFRISNGVARRHSASAQSTVCDSKVAPYYRAVEIYPRDYSPLPFPPFLPPPPTAPLGVMTKKRRFLPEICAQYHRIRERQTCMQLRACNISCRSHDTRAKERNAYVDSIRHPSFLEMVAVDNRVFPECCGPRILRCHVLFTSLLRAEQIPSG